MTQAVSGERSARGQGAGGFVAVDWGTSARRAYAVDAEGRVFDEVEDDAGILSIPRERFAAEAEALCQRFGGLPLLMAGMVGSNRGWMEAPYVACPASLGDLVARLLWVEPGRIRIVPGVSLIEGARADVMRGEEVQVFGLRALGLAEERTIICHPGTHTKWIELEGDTITRFATVMTGELFGLLKRHSILADLLAAPAAPGAAFARGVERGFAGAAIGAELFGARAGVLLGATDRDDAASLVSGLLIGSDLRHGFSAFGAAGNIVVLGRGSLTRLFAAAIEQCGYQARECDGAQAFVAGMRAIGAGII